jgi:PadR family transcriptional regulator PadR
MQGRGRGRRRRGRRATGMLQSALLLLLHRERAHGYTLLEQLGEFGLVGIDPSIVYRSLRDMEEQGWVASTWDEEETQGPPRRVYGITSTGDQVLASWIHELSETREMIDRLVGAYRIHMEEGRGEHH